jgi:hypothetical protein
MTPIATALVVPPARWGRDPATGRPCFDGGVHGPDGAALPAGRHEGGGPLNIPAATPPAPIDTLAGTWIFGGWLREDFGHFLNETLGRAWVFPGAPDVAGVLFLPYGENLAARAEAGPPRLPAFVAAALASLGAGPHRVIGRPTRVERLLVPRQIRLGVAGEDPAAEATLAATLRRLAAGGTGAGPRLYLSRARLPAHRGGLVAERVIEASLAAAGYAILHPETLRLCDQAAACAGASVIVAAEGSALHLAAPFCGPATRVAVLCRRDPPPPLFAAQLRAMGCRDVTLVRAIRGHVLSWQADAASPPPDARRNGHALLDFAAAGAALRAAGFCDTWTLPDEQAELAACLETRRAHRPAIRHAYVESDRRSTSASAPSG